METDSIFIKLLFIIYLCHFFVNPDCLIFLQNKYNFFIKLLENKNKNEKKTVDEKKTESEDLKVIKYEDKYLSEIRKMNKKFQFDIQEKEIIENKKNEFFQKENKMYIDKINEINEKLLLFEDTLLQNRECDFEKEILIITKELNDLKTEIKTEEKSIIKNAEVQAETFVIEERLAKLKNCFVMEYTPLGNVLMIYDLSRNTFKYYSDNTIPYRYLETVARKYVKLFNCRPIFIDMEEELKLFEDKLLEDKLNKEKEPSLQKQLRQENKKQIFTKFKNYNKEGCNGKVNIAPPPRNSIPNQKIEEIHKDKVVLLKEKANMYTYDGKISNYSFLKKTDRKVVDKKYAMSFTEFKKKHNK